MGIRSPDPDKERPRRRVHFIVRVRRVAREASYSLYDPDDITEGYHGRYFCALVYALVGDPDNVPRFLTQASPIRLVDISPRARYNAFKENGEYQANLTRAQRIAGELNSYPSAKRTKTLTDLLGVERATKWMAI
jgi:hypothetical protein